MMKECKMGLFGVSSSSSESEPESLPAPDDHDWVVGKEEDKGWPYLLFPRIHCQSSSDLFAGWGLGRMVTKIKTYWILRFKNPLPQLPPLVVSFSPSNVDVVAPGVLFDRRNLPRKAEFACAFG